MDRVGSASADGLFERASSNRSAEADPTRNLLSARWLGLLLAVCQRLVSVAILALLAVGMLIAGGDERWAVSVAFAGALLGGVGGGVFWAMSMFSAHQRREGRGLAIVAMVIVLLTAPLMKSPALRARLHQMNSTLSPTHENGHGSRGTNE
jgi:hypothetical protein